MKKKTKRKEKKYIDIFIEIYKMNLIIFWDSTGEEIAKYVKKYSKLDSESIKDLNKDINSGCAGFSGSLYKDGIDKIIWLKEKPEKVHTFGVLYHELHHAVEFIADDKGFNGSSITSKEAKAYLFEYIVNYCNTKLW